MARAGDALRRAVLHDVAYIRCVHPPLQARPCGQCSKGVAAALRTVPAPLVDRTARAMLALDGLTGEPTPLCRADALELLQAILPAIRAAAAGLPNDKEINDEH